MHSNFRNKEIAGIISKKINSISKDLGEIKIMHVCGTHEDTITRYGIRSLLPENIGLISGPGCPVCVTTQREIDEALFLAEKGITITTFGDMLNVPGSNGSLADAKANGGDVRVVYSITDSVEIAGKNPEKEIVHIAIGFETTAPTSAIGINDAPENFSILSCHRLIPPAMEFLLRSEDVDIDGFINPGHVSTIIGAKAYEGISKKYGIPQVISGFEPLDVLFSVFILLSMIKKKDGGVVNEYSRVVRYEGNPRALKAMNEIFETYDVEWRGFPEIPNSGLRLRGKFSEYDARKRFDVNVKKIRIHKGCMCGEVLKGKISPDECKLFANVCNPGHPIGPCMVSKEGACGIAYRYGKDGKN